MTGASGRSLRNSASTVSPPTPESNSRMGAAGFTGAGWPNRQRRSTERRSASRLALLPPTDRYLVCVEGRFPDREIFVEAQFAIRVRGSPRDVGGSRHVRAQRDCLRSLLLEPFARRRAV